MRSVVIRILNLGIRYSAQNVSTSIVFKYLNSYCSYIFRSCLPFVSLAVGRRYESIVPTRCLNSETAVPKLLCLRKRGMSSD